MASSLESIDLKLFRATEHLKVIYDKGGAYPYAQSDVVISESEDKKTFAELSIVIGEFLYQLRSILDHLAFNLVQLNFGKIQLPIKWEKRCQFPLLTEVPTTGNPAAPHSLPLLYNYFSDRLPGISKNAFAIIEGFQPYYRGNRTPALRLWWINELSNIDKHRHLHLIRPKTIQWDVVRGANGRSHFRRTVHDGHAHIPNRIPQTPSSVNVG